MVESDPAQARYLLLKGISGLGNRTYAALTAILYAQLSGRTLVVDWSDGVYSDEGVNAFDRFFVCSSARPLSDLPETDSITPSVWRSRVQSSARTLQREYNRRIDQRAKRRLERMHLATHGWRLQSFQRHTSIDVASLGYRAEVAVFWSWSSRLGSMRPHFRGVFTDLAQISSEDIMRRILAEELILHPQIQARVDEFRALHFRFPVVGVHLRMTDRRVRIAEILVELDQLLAREPSVFVFAATDSIEGKALLERRYPGVVMTDHWYGPPGTAQHGNPESPDRLENGIEALVDLYLLGSCDYLIGDSTSSFTRLAALLQAGPGRQFVDVHPPLARHRRLKREIWLRHAASSSAASSMIRLGAKAIHPVSSFRSLMARRDL